MCALQAVKVPWGMRERANEVRAPPRAPHALPPVERVSLCCAQVHALIAGQRAHGAAAVFYTCAPDDVHQPLAVRRSFPIRAAKQERDVFPKAQEAAFISALRGRTADERVRDSDVEEGRKHHMDEASLQRLAAANPIASVLAFDHLAENVRTRLLCQSLERPGNLPLPNAPSFAEGANGNEGTRQERKKGVFGVCYLNRDVKECNKRAAMHEHGQLHGGCSPALLADVASNDQLRQLALDAIDTHVKGELPLEYHAIKVMQDVLKVPSRRDAAFEIPTPERTREEKETDEEWARYLNEQWWKPELLHHACVVVMNRHTHEHQATCAGAGKDGKGKGKWMCRMCAPWGHDVPRTRCVELRAHLRDEPAEEVDVDAAADDSVEVHFYIHVHGRMPALESNGMETGTDGWPDQLDRTLYRRLQATPIPLAARRSHLRRVANELLAKPKPVHVDSLFHVFGAKEVTSTLGEALLEHASSERARGPVRIIVREPIEYRCSYCYPHCLLGKKVGRDITEKERDEAIRREDNLRDLYYHAYVPTPAGCDGSDQRSLVVDLRRRLLPTEDDEEPFGGVENELAALVKKVREHEHARDRWDAVGIDEVIERIALIDAPGQRLHALLEERPEYRPHRARLDQVKLDAQHVATCMRRIKQRLLELCERGELGARRARLEQAKQAAGETVHVTRLVEQLRGLLAPDERELLGLDLEDVTRATLLEKDDGLWLRQLLNAWGSPEFVCRNGIIADWNPVMAACTAGNAVPLTLGAGSASKATAMYSVRARRSNGGGAGK